MSAPIDTGCADALSFLQSILPSSGLYVLATFSNPKGAPKHYVYSTIEELAETAIEADRKGLTAYHACATYKQNIQGKGMRKKVNALAAKALWVDLDVGKANDKMSYETLAEATESFRSMLAETGLPKPTIINSGMGLHLYWVLTEALERDEWEALAGKLHKTLAEAEGFKQDSTCTRDIARILRPVGTTWRKHGEERPVKLVLDSSPSEPLALETILDTYLKSKGLSQPPKSRFTADDSLVQRSEYPPSSALKIIEQCPSMAAIAESKGVAVEPVWRAMLGVVKHCTEGEELCHEWSSGYDGYDYSETQTKIDGWKMGPASCETFKDYMDECKGCERNIASPISLGYSSLQIDIGNKSYGISAKSAPGDQLSGRVFAQQMKDSLRYVAANGKWLRWGGVRWEWCERGEEMVAAKKVADTLLDKAVDAFKADPVRAKKLLTFAQSLQNLKQMKAMLEMAKSERDMTIAHLTELDSDRHLLGVRNGVINLRTGKLQTPSPDDLITRQAAASHALNASCPKWVRFLNDIFQGSTDSETKEMTSFMQVAIGYSLTGEVTEEVMMTEVGIGANGKSVKANVVSVIAGDYAQTAPPSLLVKQDSGGGPRDDIARTCGARILQINELQSGDRLDEQVLKMLAGREKIAARFMYRGSFEFWPTFTPWLRTNHKPIIIGDDDGIWRRLVLIQFLRKFTGGDANPNLERELLEERDGILMWMTEGATKWYRDGLKLPQAVRRESARYRKESDLLGEFLDDETTADDSKSVPQKPLFNRWREWCQSSHVNSGSQNTFTRRLKERGFGVNRSGVRSYTGLTLSSRPFKA